MDPLEQAEEVLKAAEQDVLAEQMKLHAEMILLTAMGNKAIIQGNLLADAVSQGIDYLTGTLVAVGLAARSWSRVIAGDATMDLVKYINPEAEAFCQGNDHFAHVLVKAILGATDTGGANVIRKMIKSACAEFELGEFERMYVHMIGLFAELVNGLMDVRNGDYKTRGTGS